FETIGSRVGPATGDIQSMDWQVPIDLETERARARVTVIDGSGNSASALSSGKFDVWPLPIINGADYIEGSKPELRLSGRFFRTNETEIWVDGKRLKKIRFEEKFDTGKGTSKKVSSFDKKLHKRLPVRKRVKIEVRIPKSGQVSPTFEFKRKLPPTT
ncbi:MAG TPA: hypothetical protein VLE20_15910, partial [Blastocatellia bacterium]|nr:hypothetical protein [Blastocatellia bacterium]